MSTTSAITLQPQTAHELPDHAAALVEAIAFSLFAKHAHFGTRPDGTFGVCGLEEALAEAALIRGLNLGEKLEACCLSAMPRVHSFERAHNRAELLPLPCPGVYNGTTRLYRLNNTYRGFDYVVASHSSHIPESLLFGCGPDGDACSAGWVELAGAWFQRASDSSLLEEIGYYLEDEVTV